MKVDLLMRKVILWRCISILTTLIIVWLSTGDLKSASGITLFLHIFLTLFHYVFEKLWANLYESR